MTVTNLFNSVFENLSVTNAEEIASRRDEITKALNKHFRNSDSVSANRLMGGSYGRNTAINGVSDLDLLYILPGELRAVYSKEKGSYKALQAAKNAISRHYSTSNIKVDRLVVVVEFSTFKFEVQPVFELSDGSFSYPDTYSDSWKTTKPCEEIDAMSAINVDTNGNARKLCRLARAWKSKHDAPLNGLLIDTLVWRFLTETEEYQLATTRPDYMIRDFFAFIHQLPKQSYFNALGSRQQVKVKRNFQEKAGEAKRLCDEAIDADGSNGMNDKWKRVFGRFVPTASSARESSVLETPIDTEEFIEVMYPVIIKFQLDIDCTVTQNGFRPTLLSSMLAQRRRLKPDKRLEFTANTRNIPEPFELKWKVLNRGDEARRRNCIRGQIVDGSTRDTRVEHTSFRGDHLVECYVLKGGTIVAQARIDVPITV